MHHSPEPTLNFYERQLGLPEIGLAGQARLKESAVLVIGAGGLGSPVLFNLAGAGVGRIGIVDVDTIAVSNLNRQFLYTVADLGQPKAEVAARRLRAYHPDLLIEPCFQQLDETLALDLFPAYDVIVACVDNNVTRCLINKVCHRLGKSLIDGGIRGLAGYCTWIEPGVTPCFDCLFGLSGKPENNLAHRPARLSPLYALGATASVIGSLQATLVLLQVLGQANPLAGEILQYHGRSLVFDRIKVERDPICPICGDLFAR